MYVQIAMLYTNQQAEVRLRVFNIGMTVVAGLNNYFKSCNCEALTQYTLRQHLAKLDKVGSHRVRTDCLENFVCLLTKYRQQCSPNSAPSQLVIPEGIKLMPVYMLSAFKHSAFKLLSNS